MKNHIEFAHPRLVASKQLAINVEKINKFAKVITHNQQLVKKWFGPTCCAIMTYVGAMNPYKKFDESQQQFIESLAMYIYKG
jgi:hypothetical protein